MTHNVVNGIEYIDGEKLNGERPKWLKWHLRFLEQAKLVASYSKDPSTKVGAVIVDKDNVIVGMGYNGFPRGVSDSEERLNNRELKYQYVVHAEVNAILNSSKTNTDCTIYVWPTLMLPSACPRCVGPIINSRNPKITKIVMYDSEVLNDRWAKDQEISRSMFEEAGVRMWVIKV